MALKTLETVRSNVKRLREERGLSQRDLAKLADVQQAHIGRLEGNPENFLLGPTLYDLERIADAR